jgi:hypothetical protein
MAGDPRTPINSALQSAGNRSLTNAWNALVIAFQSCPATRRRNHGLATRTLIPTGDTIDLSRWPRPNLLDNGIAIFARRLFQANRSEE